MKGLLWSGFKLYLMCHFRIKVLALHLYIPLRVKGKIYVFSVCINFSSL